MPYTITTIHPSGRITTESVPRKPKLDKLRQAVGGGWIEIVPRFTMYNKRRCTVYCDEEGKLKGQPFNPVATKLWRERLPYNPDTLVGLVAIVQKEPTNA